jgi:hypothetical protein
LTLAGTSAELEQPQDKSQNKKEYSCEKKKKKWATREREGNHQIWDFRLWRILLTPSNINKKKILALLWII